jgi:hypothetical protein
MRSRVRQRGSNSDASVACPRFVTTARHGIPDELEEHPKCCITLLDIRKPSYVRAAETREHLLELGTEVSEEFPFQVR